MNGDRYAELAFLVLAMTLPLSALITRRLPLGETARTVAIWIVIIVGTVFLVAIARGSIAAIKARLWPAPTRSNGHITIATSSYILHNIYYQDDGDRREG